LDRVLHGLEPFGAGDPSGESIYPSGLELEPAGLVVIDFEQDVPAFVSATTRAERRVGLSAEAAITGSAPALLRDTDDRAAVAAAGAGGHGPRMKASMDNANGVLLRRSLPYRRDGREGLALVVASNRPAVLAQALEAFMGDDPLRAYAKPLRGGAYVCPP